MIIHPLDNVEIRDDGHKYALRAIRAGENVIKYGMPIGHATCDIAPGEHVHVHNVATNLGDNLTYIYEPDSVVLEPPPRAAEIPTFKGYRHPDGRVGVRNDIWVVPTVGCVNNLCERLAASCGGIALTHPYGCSQLGADHEMTANLLAALCRHPNAGGVLVVALGCENNTLDSFKERLGDISTLNIRFLRAQDPGDEYARGLELIKELESNRPATRVDVPVSELVERRFLGPHGESARGALQRLARRARRLHGAHGGAGDVRRGDAPHAALPRPRRVREVREDGQRLQGLLRAPRTAVLREPVARQQGGRHHHA